MEPCYEIQIIFDEEIGTKIAGLWERLRNKGIMSGFLMGDVPHITLMRTTSPDITKDPFRVELGHLVATSPPVTLCFQAVSSWMEPCKEGDEKLWDLQTSALQYNVLLDLQRKIFALVNRYNVNVVGNFKEFEAHCWMPICSLAKHLRENLVRQAFMEAMEVLPLQGRAWKVALVTYNININRPLPLSSELGLIGAHLLPEWQELFSYSLPQHPSMGCSPITSRGRSRI